MFLAEEINVRVKHKGMTSAEWNKSTVILMERELGVATDTGEVRVGNGKDRWANLPIIKGEKGEPLKVESTTKNSQGDTIIKFDDGSSATVSKGDKGDSITVESHEKDSQGNTVINFSDGSNVTVDKGDSIKVESTSTDKNGNTLVKFSDGSSATIAKGDKGDPLKFEDLTQEQINQIKAQDVDLSNYATKDDLAEVDVSSQLVDYAKKDHKHEITDVDGLQDELKNKASSTHMHDIADVNGLQGALDSKASSTHYHEIADINNLQTALNGKAPKNHTHENMVTEVYNYDGEIVVMKGSRGSSRGKHLALKDHTHTDLVKEVGVDSNGKIAYLQGSTWRRTSSSSFNREVALKNHTHPEYLKKGDPIELTSAQKSELKGADGKDGLTTFIRYANNPSGYNMTASPQSDTTHIGIFSSGGRVAPTTPSVYQWTKIKGEPGKQGNPGTPGRDGTSIQTWVGTQAQYDSIWSKSSTTLYLIKG